jgi:hypothetical protein
MNYTKSYWETKILNDYTNYTNKGWVQLDQTVLLKTLSTNLDKFDEISFDKFSVEFTWEPSLFYWIIIKDWKFAIEIRFCEELPTVTQFNLQKPIINKSGELDELINWIKTFE